MSFYLDTNVVISLFIDDAKSAATVAWMGQVAKSVAVSSWLETELNSFMRRNVRTGVMTALFADRKLAEIDQFISGHCQRIELCAASGNRAAALARDPMLKLSAADALHLGLSSHNGHILVTFDMRLAEAARLRGHGVEVP